MKRTTTMVVCDICKAEARCGRYDSPDDPWVRINVSGFWVSEFGRGCEAELHACGPGCVVALLEKVTDRMKRLQKRFPQALAAK